MKRKKSRWIPWTPLEYAGFQWTPPDSSRNKHADLALVTPRHSGIPGVSGREGGGVYSPPLLQAMVDRMFGPLKSRLTHIFLGSWTSTTHVITWTFLWKILGSFSRMWVVSFVLERSGLISYYIDTFNCFWDCKLLWQIKLWHIPSWCSTQNRGDSGRHKKSFGDSIFLKLSTSCISSRVHEFH